MASEESAERNLPATERQRQRFAERGDVPRSRDLSTALTLSVVAYGGYVTLRQAGAALYHLMVDTYTRLDKNADPHLWGQHAAAIEMVIIPLFAACLLGAAASAALQSGGRFTLRPLSLDLTRINPIGRFGQLFSPIAALRNSVWSGLKVALVAAVAWNAVHHRVPRALSQQSTNLWAAMHAYASVLGTLTVHCLAALLVLGMGDYAKSWWSVQKRMRMTHQEMKDELRQETGDPRVRAKRRRRHLDMIKKQSISAVAKADVVVVNPTHYAVALQYHAATMAAPRLVAKGADHAAERIRHKARQHGVPIVSQPPLTRMLYAKVQVGRPVPSELYHAVALVLAHVYSLRRSA